LNNTETFFDERAAARKAEMEGVGVPGGKRCLRHHLGRGTKGLEKARGETM
jgi:hypothetical protein